MSAECPHCGHAWAGHNQRSGSTDRCHCGCQWTEPQPPPPPPTAEREYPYDGVISASGLQAAFWRAAKATFEDETVFSMDMPYFDEEMDTVDGHIPGVFWEHMVKALAEDES